MFFTPYCDCLSDGKYLWKKAGNGISGTLDFTFFGGGGTDMPQDLPRGSSLQCSVSGCYHGYLLFCTSLLLENLVTALLLIIRFHSTMDSLQVLLWQLVCHHFQDLLWWAVKDVKKTISH